MKTKLLLAIFPYLILSTTQWNVVSSSITFKIKNAGLTIDGSFRGLNADIRFDPLKPQEANITASISSESLNTDNDMRDNHLCKADYFDVEKYPKITMQSTRITKTGPVNFNGSFKLTMKGVSKEVNLPFNFINLPDKKQLKGTFSINRRDFGIGGNSISLADSVTISVLLNVTE
jgi:polyisoprenoid-binding protein YceI